MLAHLATDRTNVDLVGPDVQCILVALAGAGLRIDYDQGVAGDLQDARAVVAKVLLLAPGSREFLSATDKVRIVGSKIDGAN